MSNRTILIHSSRYFHFQQDISKWLQIPQILKIWRYGFGCLDPWNLTNGYQKWWVLEHVCPASNMASHFGLAKFQGKVSADFVFLRDFFLWVCRLPNKNPKHSELLRQSTVGCQLQTFLVQFDDFRQIWSLQARMQDCLQQQFPQCGGEGEGYISPGNCRPSSGIFKGQWWLITLNTVDGRNPAPVDR